MRGTIFCHFFGGVGFAYGSTDSMFNVYIFTKRKKVKIPGFDRD
jgi:hypothetical protein